MYPRAQSLDPPSDPLHHWGTVFWLHPKFVKLSPHLVDAKMVNGAGKCVSYLLPHKKITQGLSPGTRTNIYDLTVPVGQESGFDGWFWLMVSHELGLPSSEGLTEARGSTSKMA